jgi:hypothetical protein
MGKMSELALQIEELRRLGQLITDIADTLMEMFSDTGKDESEVTVPKEEAVSTLSLEEVRCILATKSRDGHSDEIKALIKEFGANRLSDINPTQYGELLKKVEVI